MEFSDVVGLLVLAMFVVAGAMFLALSGICWLLGRRPLVGVAGRFDCWKVEDVKNRKIYVASSWRNERQPHVVENLRDRGHEVYDFRHPGGQEDDGFSWRAIDPDWESWTPEQYRQNLSHPAAVQGFRFDLMAMEWADTFVLVMPCGRSAHLELGWAIGAGKESFILLGDDQEPELMYKLADHICVGWNDFTEKLG